jgi:hypothetical protein
MQPQVFRMLGSIASALSDQIQSALAQLGHQRGRLIAQRRD